MSQTDPGPSRTALERVVDRAHGHLQDLGYCETTLRDYRQVWKKVIAFSRQERVEWLSEDLAISFLSSYGISLDDSAPLSLRQRRIRKCVCRLIFFSRHGNVQCSDQAAKKVQLPAAMESVLQGYLRFCTEEKGIRSTTLRGQNHTVRMFLHFVDSQGIRSLAEITAATISDFVASRIHLMPSTVARIASVLRSCLRYLCMKQIVAEDLSPHVPKVRRWRHDRIPSVWSREDIERLLAAVDRSSPVGKRDYAILLLACRLGLRVGDIRALRLESILWEQERIEIRQSKTTVPVSLPLSQEVGQALIDYLRYGRPKTTHREVFLRANAPFQPFGPNTNLHRMIATYRRRAGIKLPDHGHWSMHSLRHTVATRLLEAETPLPTIASVLGHLSLDCTKVYTKVDIDALRTAALDPEEQIHD